MVAGFSGHNGDSQPALAEQDIYACRFQLVVIVFVVSVDLFIFYATNSICGTMLHLILLEITL